MKKKIIWIFSLVLAILVFWQPNLARAMPLGTLLYRTSNDGLAYGYNQSELITASKGKVNALYTGHAAIYVGKINGEDYIAEALANGLQLTPAKYFINTRNKEKLIGAKIPLGLSETERQRVVDLAKILAQKGLGYDFSFRNQKGPQSGDWTCVGFTEKVYESANISNPYNLQELVYDPKRYAVDITPDGYDSASVYNSQTKDCFASQVEFSKITKKFNLLVPAPELVGYDAGLEFQGNRYFFIPYTQFLQPTLKDVEPDIELSSDFNDAEIRGNVPTVSLIMRWSLINNPVSSIKQLVYKAGELLGLNQGYPQSVLALSETSTPSSVVSSTTKKSTATKTTKVTKPVTVKKTAKASSSVKKTVASNKATVQKSEPVKTVVSRSINPSSVILKTPSVTPKKSVKDNVNDDSAKDKVTQPVVNNYQTVINQPEVKPHLIIAAFGHDGSGHWLKLYNPNQEAVDLEAEGYRLEKSKTAVDPGIMVRLGNASDGSYPGGVEIAAQDTYLLVDINVSDALKQTAQAIISNTNFSWGDSGYTLFLGTNAISSDTDNDIQDKVGFGDDSNYYETAPALALSVDHYLTRKLLSNNQPGKDSDNNQNDFELLSSGNNDPEQTDETDDSGDLQDENTGNDQNSSSTDSIDDPSSATAPKILIARIFATGDDDAIELYNPNDQAVDLAIVGYRLEKGKTAVDPGILMRIGNSSDGAYPGGTIISPHQTYLIVRDDAGAILKARAQAVANTDGFTWSDDGYSIFLGTDAISGTEDPDLVDLVGFGPSALYYEGVSAPAITDHYILTRKATALSTAASMVNSLDGYGYDSDDNSQDFVLVDDGSETANENDIDNLSFNQSQDSSGLIHLWHFDECQGSEATDSIGNKNLIGNWEYRKGLFGCGLYSSTPGKALSIKFSSALNISQMTIGIWQKNSDKGQLKLRFFNQNTPLSDTSVLFSPFFTEITGLPAKQRFNGNSLPNDNAWHQIFWVIDSSHDGWRLYIDGQFVREGFFDVIFAGSYDSLSISDANGNPLIDEVALWNRSLSAAEISGIYNKTLPFSPVTKREAPITPEAVFDWSFNERQGTEAADDIHNNIINLSESAWSRTGYRDGGAKFNSTSLSSALSPTIDSQDITFDFWWRKNDGASSGQGEWDLLNGSEKILGLSSGVGYTAYQYNNQSYRLPSAMKVVIPDDNSWHHLVLSYDSYNYQLNYAIDGEVVYAVELPWLKASFIDGLKIEGSDFTIDDFRIWRGAFDETGLKQLYQGSKIN